MSSRGGSGAPRRVSLLCKNLPLDSRAEDVRKMFERYGDIRDVYLPKDYYTGKAKGFGFVEFHDHRDAEDALHALDGSTYSGRQILVVMSKESRKTPRDMIKREETYTSRDRYGSRGDRDYRDRGADYRDRDRDYRDGGRDYRDRSRSRDRGDRRDSRRRDSRSRSPSRDRARSGSRSPRKARDSRSRSPEARDRGKDSRSPPPTVKADAVVDNVQGGEDRGVTNEYQEE